MIDLSPILDVSPSLEEAEQAEMLAQQQAERERQASREDDAYEPMNSFVALGDAAAETEYMYYGLKRYDVVENISGLVEEQNFSNGTNSLLSISPSANSNGACENVMSKNNGVVKTKVDENGAKLNGTDQTIIANNSHIVISNTLSNYLSNGNGSVKQLDQTISNDSVSAKVNENVVSANKPKGAVTSSPSKGKIRRQLPEPTEEILATEKPIPKPRKKDNQSQEPVAKPPPKPARAANRQDLKEPTRNPPIYNQSALASKQVASNNVKAQSSPTLQKQSSSEEVRRTAKEMKAKPDPLIMNYLEIEEASASPQYRVLESPPSPENKAAIQTRVLRQHVCVPIIVARSGVFSLPITSYSP